MRQIVIENENLHVKLVTCMVDLYVIYAARRWAESLRSINNYQLQIENIQQSSKRDLFAGLN